MTHDSHDDGQVSVKTSYITIRGGATLFLMSAKDRAGYSLYNRGTIFAPAFVVYKMFTRGQLGSSYIYPPTNCSTYMKPKAIR